MHKYSVHTRLGEYSTRMWPENLKINRFPFLNEELTMHAFDNNPDLNYIVRDTDSNLAKI